MPSLEDDFLEGAGFYYPCTLVTSFGVKQQPTTSSNNYSQVQLRAYMKPVVSDSVVGHREGSSVSVDDDFVLLITEPWTQFTSSGST